MSLTPKQERFAQCIVSGMSGKDSYYTAYNTTCNEQVAYNEAMKLLNHEGIQERIKELRKPLELRAQTAALTETERIKALLWERIEICRQKDDEAAIARYTDQINKLNNAYRDTTTTTEDTNKLDTLDTSALQRIAKMA